MVVLLVMLELLACLIFIRFLYTDGWSLMPHFRCLKYPRIPVQDGDDQLSFEEFSRMVRDIRRCKSLSTDASDVETEARAAAR